MVAGVVVEKSLRKINDMDSGGALIALAKEAMLEYFNDQEGPFICIWGVTDSGEFST